MRFVAAQMPSHPSLSGLTVVCLLYVGHLRIVGYLISMKTRGPRRDKVLLTGVSGAGKTCVFTQVRVGVINSSLGSPVVFKCIVILSFPQLAYKRFGSTQTSQKENMATLSVSSEPNSATYTLVDVPGHSRLRDG